MTPNVQNTTNLALVLKIWSKGGYSRARQGGFEGFDVQNFSEVFKMAVLDFDFGNLNDIFSDFFGGGMGGGRKHSKARRDISTEIQISFSDSVFGVQKNFNYQNFYLFHLWRFRRKAGSKMETCKHCNGQGKFANKKERFSEIFQVRKFAKFVWVQEKYRKKFARNVKAKEFFAGKKKFLLIFPPEYAMGK